MMVMGKESYFFGRIRKKSVIKCTFWERVNFTLNSHTYTTQQSAKFRAESLEFAPIIKRAWDHHTQSVWPSMLRQKRSFTRQTRLRLSCIKAEKEMKFMVFFSSLCLKIYAGLSWESAIGQKMSRSFSRQKSWTNSELIIPFISMEFFYRSEKNPLRHSFHLFFV